MDLSTPVLAENEMSSWWGYVIEWVMNDYYAELGGDLDTGQCWCDTCDAIGTLGDEAD